MNTTPLIPLFASSQDPTQVSTTVSGFIVSGSAIIIALSATFFHITLTASNVLTLGTDLGYIAGAIVVILGLSHKLIQKYGKVSNYVGPVLQSQAPGSDPA